jgi:tetratricopeptide (TPR) repeat protein
MPAATFECFSARSARWLLLMLSLVLLPGLASAQARRVAVLDFVNTTKDPSMDWLGPSVAETMTTKLNAIRHLQLIERGQLYKVLSEQKMSLTDLVDPSQAIKIGKLVTAEQIVLGSFTTFGNRVRFTARFVDAATGTIVATSQVDGAVDRADPDRLFAAFDRLAEATMGSLNTRVVVLGGARIEPTPEEKVRFSKAPTRSLEAQEAFGRGLVAYRMNQWSDAAKQFERATIIDAGYAEGWRALGRVQLELGRLVEARGASDRAYRLYVSLDNTRGQAEALTDVGNVQAVRGQYDGAADAYRASLKLAESLDDKVEQARAVGAIGGILFRREEYREARAHFDRSHRLAELAGNERLQATALTWLGATRFVLGEESESEKHYRQALMIAQRLDLASVEIGGLLGLGQLALKRNNLTQAQNHFDRARLQAAAIGDKGQLAGALLLLGALYEQRGDRRAALRMYEESARAAESAAEEPRLVSALWSVAGTQLALGDRAEALRSVERAVEIAERLRLSELPQLRKLRDQVRTESR